MNTSIVGKHSGGTGGKDLSVCARVVFVAPPMIVGAWSMAVMLW